MHGNMVYHFISCDIFYNQTCFISIESAMISRCSGDVSVSAMYLICTAVILYV